MGRTYHVCNSIQSRDPLHLIIGNTCSAEDGGSENGYTSNTDPLLHDLKPDDELDTTTSVKFTGADTEKHRDVRLALGGFALKFSNIANILELGFGLSNIFTSLTTKTSEDIASLFFAANFDEPTGRFGEKPADSKEQ